MEELRTEVAQLREQVDRLTVKLAVALELLAECKMVGYPENVGIVENRLEQALKTSYVAAGTDEPTGKHAIIAGPEGDDAPREVMPPPGAAALPTAAASPFAAPFTPREAPLSQQTHKYDSQTERDQKLGAALDVLDSLGKRK